MNTLTCETILKVLNTKDTSALPHEEQEQLELHLADCPSCREYRQYMQLTSTALQSIDIPKVSPKLAINILEQTQQLPQEVTWRNYWSQSKWFPVTAAAAFAMSLLLVLGGLSLPVQQHTSSKLVKERFALLHGPSLKQDEISIAAGALGLELE
jgi:predicted anti-sigma-YlaC factor YlaD